jgi:hypothetical protein
MKKQLFVISVIVLALAIFVPPAAAQQQQQQAAQSQQENKILVNESDLTPDQLAKIKVRQKMEGYSETVKWGHEIGVAVNETLAALTDNTAKFSETKVGKLAMFLVAWKVMAQDVISMGNRVAGYLVGIPFLAIGLAVVVWSYRRQCVPRRVLVEKGPGFWIWRDKKYEIYDPSKQVGNMEQDEWVIAHVIVAIVIVIIASFMIFA